MSRDKWIEIPRAPRRRTRNSVSMQLRQCRCCRRLVVIVWWAEEKRWVFVLLADESGRLIFDGNPVYDRTTQTIHNMAALTRVRATRKQPRMRRLRAALEKIGPQEDGGQGGHGET